MSDNLPARRLESVEPAERVEIMSDLVEKYAEGWPYYKLARLHRISTDAVKKLLKEHAAIIRKTRPDTRSLQEEEYRRFYGEMKKIEPDDQRYPALVRSQAIQARLGVLTRLDKILGHEMQGDIEGIAEGVAGLAQRANASGFFDNISVDDLATVGDAEFEDIEEAEVIEDD